jgi:hypothetical protein
MKQAPSSTTLAGTKVELHPSIISDPRERLAAASSKKHLTEKIRLMRSNGSRFYLLKRGRPRREWQVYICQDRRARGGTSPTCPGCLGICRWKQTPWRVNQALMTLCQTKGSRAATRPRDLTFVEQCEISPYAECFVWPAVRGDADTSANNRTYCLELEASESTAVFVEFEF